MCKQAGLLMGWDTAARRVLITRADCDRWSCPECRVKLRDQWALRAEIGVRQYLRDGRVVDFVTVTSHEKLTDFAATEAVWRAAWPNLYAALKRKADRLEYMIIPERHKDGRMHVHALWTADVSKRWLKDNARRRGLGFMADVSHVIDPRAAVNYVTKYVTKDIGSDAPPHFRRVRVSSGWPEIPKPTTEQSPLKWEYITSERALMVVCEECQFKGISMIDLDTGQYFDADVDFAASER